MELREYSISEISTLKYGKMLAKEEFKEKGFPVYSGYRVTGYTDSFLYEEPMVIVVARGVGGTGDVKISPEKSWITNLSIVLDTNNELVDKYFLAALLNQDNLKAKLDSGASISQITINSLEPYRVTLPSLDVQRKASLLLKTYDHSIENNNRRIVILKEMAQSLYREWFVKFRYPGHENQNLVESPLGPIPEGWEVKRLDDFLVLQRGFDLPKQNRDSNGDIPIYAASGFSGFHNEVKARAPGIVTGRSGTLGIVTLILDDFWPLNTSLWIKEFKNCSAFYAYYLLQGLNLERFNSGSSVPTLNRNDVHGHEVISPPLYLIKEFEIFSEGCHRSIKNLRNKNENLKSQRDMLLPKLISGQIDLSEEGNE